MNEAKDYLEIMAKTSESTKLLIEMTAEIIEREVQYLDSTIDFMLEQKLFMGAVTEKLDMLKKGLVEHLINVKQFIKDEEEEETETLQ